MKSHYLIFLHYYIIRFKILGKMLKIQKNLKNLKNRMQHFCSGLNSIIKGKFEF